MSEQMVMDFHAKQGLETTSLTPMNGTYRRYIWAAHLQCMSQSRYVFDPENPAMYRAHLMLQELGEVLEGLHDGDHVKLADGLADLVYVAIGTAVQFEIPFDPVFLEIHRSNMTKDHVMQKNRGKGDSYSPPNIEGVLDANG